MPNAPAASSFIHTHEPGLWLVRGGADYARSFNKSMASSSSMNLFDKFPERKQMHKKAKPEISTGAWSSILKWTGSRIDPYTRLWVGMTIGFGIVAKYGDENSSAVCLGTGVMMGSLLPWYDATKGGRLVKNQSNAPVYTIGESSGVSVLEPGQIPTGCIVGFSFKGLNGVFKLSGGVHAHINSNHSVEYTPGLGRFIHQHVRRGGFKTKQWVDQQSDLRWKELYDTQF